MSADDMLVFEWSSSGYWEDFTYSRSAGTTTVGKGLILQTQLMELIECFLSFLKTRLIEVETTLLEVVTSSW